MKSVVEYNLRNLNIIINKVEKQRAGTEAEDIGRGLPALILCIEKGLEVNSVPIQAITILVSYVLAYYPAD